LGERFPDMSRADRLSLAETLLMNTADTSAGTATIIPAAHFSPAQLTVYSSRVLTHHPQFRVPPAGVSTASFPRNLLVCDTHFPLLEHSFAEHLYVRLVRQ
ncbi:hypothetical protein R6H00_02445, partial [Actinotignum timonense]|nr:hypothetical protein [Actinotignum timonense]